MEMDVDYQRHQMHQALAEEQNTNTNRIVNVDSNDPEGFGFGHEATNFSEGDLEHLGRWISDAFAAGMHDEHFLMDPDYESDGDSEAGLPESLWFPFPHKEYYVAELILGHLHHMLSRVVYDNIRVGVSILNLILPHWDSMRRTRQKIRKLLDIHIMEHETVFNITCFSLSLKDILAHELANPYVVEHLEFYPHETNGKNIRALYHSAKWREHLGREYRVQMVPAGGKHYYIYEPVTLRNGRIVVPIFFYKHETVLRSKCVIPKFAKATNHNNSGSSQQSQGSIEFDFYIRSNIQYDSPDVLDIEVGQFDKIYSEIVCPRRLLDDGPSVYMMLIPHFFSEIGASRSSDPIVVPNPWRIRAKNKIIRHVPLTLYADDTSGNKSKRWNKHISFYLTLSGLPPEMTNMEYNCHFVTTSNVASPLELAEPVVSQLNQLSTKGAFGFDATLKEEVMFMCIPLDFLADSPMAAEFTNTPNPGKANNPCRMCHLQTNTVENRCTLEFIKAFFGQPQMPASRKWHQTISRCKTQKVVVRPFLLNGEGDGGGASSALLYYQITRPTKLSLASFNQVIGFCKGGVSLIEWY
ncbi:uncharacterized protein PGTG_02246 [Puccinia graminis f. sp. tritici CRL 75-36-700-3]|uniref:Uncharacterized protein n=1 Tax=Puccinia graminis f. sp. tritici (strain CRL 75-36-700-3 / race SCCL) TaxID=418459 RepID=E3JXL0_PUCGT|nr:uncharacterized protein PGTG_02246 [Puccinia graminis f. sp. tritici CRL 75-36-700-3]EFP76785.2 hypothetical protein PGTG_02246 [Puccinia graminis f. sp. tritici CRL 75-36-700-3]